MRFNIVKEVFKKEIIYLLRDKKTVILGILLPMLLYPLMMIIFSQVMQGTVSDLPKKELNIAVKGHLPWEIESSIKEYKSDEMGSFGKIKIVKVDDYDKAISEEKILAYIEVSPDEKTYSIATNSSKTNANSAYNTLESIFKEYKKSKVNTNLELAGLNPDNMLNPINYEHKEVAKTEEMAGSMVGSILPIILVASILVGVIYLSIDVMAGEKERGTLETLLTLPISNLEIVTGKYLAVSLSAIITAFCNILSIALTVIYLIAVASIDAKGLGLGDINYSSFAFAIIITVICICLFAMVVSALTMCICSLAKSYKEAQSYVTPLTLGVLMLSYASLIPTINLNLYTASIPFVNISLLIRDVLSLKIEPAFIAVVLVSNLVLVMLSVILLSKMFKSEEILFGSVKEFSLFEKRSNLKKGNMPGVSDGIVMFCIAILVHIYLGSYIQLNFGTAGLAMSLIILALIPLIYAWYMKADFKELFSLKLPKIKYVFIGILIWLGAFLLAQIISIILLNWFPQSNEELKAIEEALTISNLPLNLIVVALLPAICEETLFRGFIYGALKKGGNYKLAIWGSALLFGIMHLSLIKLPATTILGLALAYSLYKSGSILIPMMIHFINNALAVLSLHYGVGKVEEFTGLFGINYSYTGVALLVGVTLIYLGTKRKLSS